MYTSFTGVAVGAGWQATVAFINLGCYYLLGLVPGGVLGFKFGMGLEASLKSFSSWFNTFVKDLNTND